MMELFTLQLIELAELEGFMHQGMMTIKTIMLNKSMFGGKYVVCSIYFYIALLLGL